MKLRSVHADIILAVALGAVAAWFFWKAWQLPPALNPSDVGPGQFPMLIAAAAIVCALGVIVGTLRKASLRVTVALPRPRAILYAIVALAAYGFAVPVLGFYISTALLVVLLMLIAGDRRWLVLTAAAIGFDLFAYLCFGLLLNVPLS